MNNTQLENLTREISEYNNSKQYGECVKLLKTYETQEQDPQVLLIIRIAIATCSMRLGDVVTANNALGAVTRDALNNVELLYFDLAFAALLQEQNNHLEAKKILISDLEVSELHLSENRDVLCEMLARIGFSLAELGDTNSSIQFLKDSLDILQDDDELRDTIFIYLGYDCQSIGRLDDAKRWFLRVINDGGGGVIVDAYYRLGGLYLEQHAYGLAVEMFKMAESAIPMGRTRLEDILIAESDAYRSEGRSDLADEVLERSRTIVQ